MVSRILWWDILRLLVFQAIVYFHFNYLIWYEDFIVAATKSKWFLFWDVYSRFLSHSGFTIVILSSFLYGYSQKSILARSRTLGLLLIGWLFFLFINWQEGEEIWSWDVYPLLGLGFGICLMVEAWSRRRAVFLAPVGLVVLLLPWGRWFDGFELSQTWKQVWTGICPSDYADWPILPWVGLICLGFGLGRWVQINEKSLHRLRRWEWPLLLISFFLFVWASFQFYRVRPGANFSCDVFHFKPIVFFGYLAGILYLIRFGLIQKFQMFLSSKWLVLQISRLRISQNFWLTYVIHYLLFYTLSSWGEFLHARPNLSAAIVTFTIPFIEALLRLFQRSPH